MPSCLLLFLSSKILCRILYVIGEMINLTQEFHIEANKGSIETHQGVSDEQRIVKIYWLCLLETCVPYEARKGMCGRGGTGRRIKSYMGSIIRLRMAP